MSSSLSPLSIATPLRFGGDDDGLLKMHTSLADQVNDNLKNLIMTNWGERLGLFDFGANLRDVVTEMSSNDDFNARAADNIKGAVDKWMPYVSLQSIESTVDHAANLSSNGTAVVRLLITYNVSRLNVRDRVLEVTLYAI